jgi:prepilin-type N-terminal cleavage/methylation domain-containing protein
MSRSARTGLSLIEVLVVIAIVAVLIGLFMPATRRVGNAAARSACVNNLKMIGLALQGYHDAHHPGMSRSAESDSPIDTGFPTGCVGPGEVPDERLSWMVAVLPFIEQEPLYRQFHTNQGYAANEAPARTVINSYRCPAAVPSKTGDAVTHYPAMAGLGADAPTRPNGAPGNGFMGYDRRTRMWMIQDGISNTIAVMETRHDVGPWARGGTSTVRGYDPGTVPSGDQPPPGSHPNGWNALFVDGGVRFLRDSVKTGQLAAAMTIDGGEPAPDLD